MKIRLMLVLLTAFSLFACSKQGEAPKAPAKVDDQAAHENQKGHDVHQMWRTVKPFPAQVVREAAADSKFEAKSSSPPEANDVMDYWNVVPPKPTIKKEGPIILGKVTFKHKGLRLGGEKEIKAGDYLHWIGKVSQVWLGGFAAAEGAENLAYGVRFGNPPGVGPHGDDSTGHIHVLTHTPEDSEKLRELALLPLPLPQPPPPRPPRCVIQCRWIVDLDTGQHKWVPTEWILVP